MRILPYDAGNGRAKELTYLIEGIVVRHAVCAVGMRGHRALPEGSFDFEVVGVAFEAEDAVVVIGFGALGQGVHLGY